MSQFSRRRFLGAGLGAAAAGMAASKLLVAPALAASSAAPAGAPETSGSNTVLIENFSPAGNSLGIERVPKVSKSDTEWHSQLSGQAFDVTRRAGTEIAFTGAYASNHADGLYHCVCCNTPLFDSRTKFESGTGWPSFWQPISPKNVVKTSDSSFGMQRDAISCTRCDAHLGHVFDDGPKPTGLRYCMNSVSLHFVPRAAA